MTPPLTGLVAAPFTPFAPDGAVRYPLIPRLGDHLAAQGVAAVFVCGTTGEGTSLTDAERREVAEAWIAAARGRMRVIVHVGHLSTPASRDLATHAQAAGADAVASSCPSFFPIATIPQLVAAAAGAAAGAPRLPFYFYHIPALTRLRLSMVEFLAAAGAQIPNLRGVKFTHDDFEEFVRLLRLENGRYDILSGREQALLAAAACGGRGAIGSNFNLAAPIYAGIQAAVARGDLVAARELQATGIELTLILRRHGGLPAAKAAMELFGLDCGPVRPPLRPLLPAEKTSLHRALREWGRLPLPDGQPGPNGHAARETSADLTAGGRIGAASPP